MSGMREPDIMDMSTAEQVLGVDAMPQSVQTDLAEETRRADDKTQFGFWVYLMTDCVLFAVLFATFAVLRGNTFGGPSGANLFSLPNVLAETLLLLTSSFTCGLAMIATQRRDRQQALWWLGATFVLGAAFLGLELREFHQFALAGNGWQRSGFLGAFFTLVGTHGLHISVGLLWLVTNVVRLGRSGFGRTTVRRLQMFSLFWHFLDVIWIFIFSIVYLLGAIS